MPDQQEPKLSIIEKLAGNLKNKIREFYTSQRELEELRTQRRVLTEEVLRLSSDNADLWEMLEEIQASDEALMEHDHHHHHE